MRNTLLVNLVCLSFVALPAFAQDRPLVMVLTETGQTREGAPVLQPHPEGAGAAAILSRGFSGRALRLFRYEQTFLHKKGGPEPEPAYLLLSQTQGGFPRFGFYLGDQDKRHAGYVDLHHRQTLTGRFGAMDQIFPHELAHVMVQQLSGPPAEGGANQVHAIGVRTDPFVAFNEGFAEHFQVLAAEDADADPATRAVVADAELRERAFEQVRAYRRELEARWSPATRRRMTFPLWFSGAEQALRYHAVKANAFAHEPDAPARLLTRGELYSAYLLENTLPGNADATAKPAGRLLSTEGVVSYLFYHWATDKQIGETYRDQDFYAQFGADRNGVSPIENVYLKLFYVFYTHKPHDTAHVITAYKATFPDEAPLVDAIVRDAFLGQALPTAAPLWLANRDFKTGTTVFDQFRGAPRIHTFDLNAASLVDLMSVPGINRSLAEAMLRRAPFGNLDDLQHVQGVNPALVDRFKQMAVEMERMRQNQDEVEHSLRLSDIFMPAIWRAVGFLLLAAALGAMLYRAVRRTSWWRAAVNGFGAALIGLLAGWLVGGQGVWTILAPLVLFGIPAALWQLKRHRAWEPVLRVLLAWAATPLPAAVLVRPWL
jgi:hypothetical protein